MDTEAIMTDAPAPSERQTSGTPPPPLSPNAASTSAAAAASGVIGPGHVSFRRQRASRACETCHARKVRCDAASLGVPCTNCVAFRIECRIPTPKRKKAQTAASTASQSKDSDSDRGPDNAGDPSPRPAMISSAATRTPSILHSVEGTPANNRTEAQARQDEVDNGTYLDLVMKPKFTRAPITDAGRVAYLGESSNLTLLVHDRQGSDDVVHYPLPENVRGPRARLTELDNLEIDILHQRGAFLLPPRSLCDELIDAYFKWVHPIVPVINRARFMRQYRDPKNPPSLMLLQAVLLAGCRVCNNPQLTDANGSTAPAALTFYKRAKALYDANYEDDRVTIVQSLTLISWFWDGPEDVTRNVFYWSRVAIIVAQGTGMHRSVERSQLSQSDKRLWKRIWWTLFSRDRSVAVALGRPVLINTDDTDVEMITEDDFVEDETDRPNEYPEDPVHVQFFLQSVKLAEIMGLVLSQQYSVASKHRPKTALDLTHCDMALADWLQNCPKIVCWEASKHHFWSALLHSNYYTTLCLLHRAHIPPTGGMRLPDDSPYPSRNIAFQAAAMNTSIIEHLAARDELRYTPAFIVYTLFSALIMHVYQMRSPVPSVQQATQERLRICMQALKEVSKIWLVGRMVYTLFESILGNKVLEERLQKASRHRRTNTLKPGTFAKPPVGANQPQAPLQQTQQAQQMDTTKRKFEDMAIDFAPSTPTPQESYERSRPQTPSARLGEAAPENPNNLAPPPTTTTASPHVTRQATDAFMGGSGSRPQTRPTTPFNPSFSVPATPPDLYLVTRNSPNLSYSLWENFQPDQLFPENSSMPVFSMQSPQLGHQHLDPNLMGQMGSAASGIPQGQSGATASSHGHMPPGQPQGQVPQGAVPKNFENHTYLQPDINAFANGTAANLWQPNFDGMAPPDGQSPSDSWSTGSGPGQPAPTNLNVEDWFQFFGINGDAALNVDMPMGP